MRDRAVAPFGHNAGVIGNDEEAATVWVLFDLVDDVGELVDGLYFPLAVGCFPAAPLFAVDGAEIAVFIRPFIPNAYAVFLEVGDICVTRDEPKQFVDDGF